MTALYKFGGLSKSQLSEVREGGFAAATHDRLVLIRSNVMSLISNISFCVVTSEKVSYCQSLCFQPCIFLCLQKLLQLVLNQAQLARRTTLQ